MASWMIRIGSRLLNIHYIKSIELVPKQEGIFFSEEEHYRIRMKPHIFRSKSYYCYKGTSGYNDIQDFDFRKLVDDIHYRNQSLNWFKSKLSKD